MRTLLFVTLHAVCSSPDHRGRLATNGAGTTYGTANLTGALQ
jgi:hypothetical protein